MDSIDYFSFSIAPPLTRSIPKNLSSLWKREAGRYF
jgi:hypothetical protein